MSNDAVVGSAAVRTNELGIREIVRRLNAGLGPTLVAGLAGSKDRRISHKWAKEDGPEPNQAAVRRLMAAIRLWTELSEAHGEHVARLWFIGSNPWLEEDSPRGGHHGRSIQGDSGSGQRHAHWKILGVSTHIFQKKGLPSLAVLFSGPGPPMPPTGR